MQKRAPVADGPDIVRAAAPHAEKVCRRSARDSSPGVAVPAQDAARRADGPHVVVPAAPHRIQHRRSSAPEPRPPVAFPVQDRALESHRPDVVGGLAPHGLEVAVVGAAGRKGQRRSRTVRMMDRSPGGKPVAAATARESEQADDHRSGNDAGTNAYSYHGEADAQASVNTSSSPS